MTHSNFYTFFDSEMNPKWDYIMTLPEFVNMISTPHSSYWHCEGNPIEHTKLVVKCAIDHLKSMNIKVSEDESPAVLYMAQAFLMAALFHDIAKPIVTVYDASKNDWSAPFHAETGAKLTRKILMRLEYEDARQRELIVSMVRVHMMMHHIIETFDKVEKKLFKFTGTDETLFCDYSDAVYLCMCDDFSSWCKDESQVSKISRHFKRERLKRVVFSDGFSLDRPDTMKQIAMKNIYGNAFDPEKKYITVHVLIGLPGSGKSTYARKNYPDLEMISRDIIRYELGYCGKDEKYLGTKEEENRVTQIVEQKIVNLADEGKSFVIDNTHLRQKYRDRLHELLKNYNVKYHYIYVEAPSFNENIMRRHDEFGERSEAIITSMLDTFEFPYPYEFDEFDFIKQNEDNL